MNLRKNLSIHLDFSIPSVEGRRDYICKVIEDLNKQGYSPVNSELELFSNYILYGKDDDGTSAVDRKEIQIDTKYKTYNKKEEQSLEELCEMPGFSESTAINNNPIQYRVKKQKFDREKMKDVEELQPLFEQIDELDLLLRAYDGKLEDNDENKKYIDKAKRLCGQAIYKMRHLLIELRREQYTIKDFYYPVLQRLPSHGGYRGGEIDSFIPWQEGTYEIAPLGFYHKGVERFENPAGAKEEDYQYNKDASFILDFRNQEHLYELFEMYLELETAALDDPESSIIPLLDTLRFYIDHSSLSEEQKEILYYKMYRVPNVEIARIINDKYETNHSLNYISTIYKQIICPAVADYVRYHYREYECRNDRFSWKRCNCCGKLKLKDIRNFVRKARSCDGLANRCKECDKFYRGSTKGGKGIE